jgi:pimeloyl-ACP methyl ester carboxylesterase
VRVSVGDVRLFFEAAGAEWVITATGMERRPIIIGLHGGPGIDGGGLRHRLAPLADVAQVIVPDLRGHGRSDAGARESWSLPTWAADIRGFCGTLNIERPFVLGLSFGGFVAQEYASTHSDDIAGLILISTAARFPLPDEVIARVRAVGGDEAAEAMRRDIDNPTDETAADVRRLLYARRADPDALATSLEAHAIRTPEVIQQWWPVAHRTIDLRRALQSVRCPTLVLVGEHDPLNPPALAEEIVGSIPEDRAELVVVPDAAHRVFTDNPDHVYGCIRRFISRTVT